MVALTPRTGPAAPVITDDADRWAAVQRRDTDADGAFYYAVRTTGVYCRPSCASRAARRVNVIFYTTRADAERAGFRPCKRCRPNGPALAERHAAVVANACRLIEAAAETPPLAALAAVAGMSPHHFHRVFKSATGLTPKAYALARRAQRVREELARRDSVTAAIYGAGLRSNGRAYAATTDTLGMTPATYRAGGTGETIRVAVGDCSLGVILVAATATGVCAISLGDDPEALLRDLQDRFPNAALMGGDRDFEQLVAAVVAFVEAPAIGLDLPLDVRGTAFQQRVWRALREIPAGATASYVAIAERLGAPRRRPRRGLRVRGQPARRRHPLPPRGAPRRGALRIPVGRGAQARPPRPRGQGRAFVFVGADLRVCPFQGQTRIFEAGQTRRSAPTITRRVHRNWGSTLLP